MATGVTSEQRAEEDMNSVCQSTLEDMPIEEAKALIKRYFEEHHGENFDYGDLREALCIALPIIVEACDQLEREGKIAGVN
jgi:DNA-binding MarR family transcriptional regulator